MHLEIWSTKCRSFCRAWICYNAMLVNHTGGHKALQWRHNGRDSVSNHQPRECLLSRLIRRRTKKTSKLRVTGLCAGNSPGTGEFPAQMASNAENVSIWWRHQSKCGEACRRIHRMARVSLNVFTHTIKAVRYIVRVTLWVWMLPVVIKLRPLCCL